MSTAEKRALCGIAGAAEEQALRSLKNGQAAAAKQASENFEQAAARPKRDTKRNAKQAAAKSCEISNSDFVYRLPAGRIAILLASYNGARYLEEQLESLRRQKHTDFVCFIHDDGSTDGTQEIASAWCSRYPEQFIYMGCYSTGGAKYNFMHMLQSIEADYIMFCDQDDIWLPEKVEKTYRAMKRGEDGNTPMCVFSDLTVVDAELNIINSSFFVYSGLNPHKTSLSELLYDNVAPGCTMMINRSLREMALAADVTDLILMHDWHIMLLAASAGKIILLEEPLILYRQHGDNTFGAQKGSRNYFYKLRHLFDMGRWLRLQKESFAIQKSNAQALLRCLEAVEDTAQSDRLTDSMKEIRTFIRRANAPLVIKIIRCYRVRWGKALEG